MLLRVMFFTFLCFYGGQTYALDDGAPALHRGLNLSSWLANAPRQPLTAKDFALVRRAGFDHVRLPVNPEFMGFHLDNTADAPDSGFAPVDAAIAMAEANHLRVILDIHPTVAFKTSLENDPIAAERFNALWHALAVRYQGVGSDELIFEPINEPGFYHKGEAYRHLVEQWVGTIHGVSPKRAIIIDQYGDAQMLKPLAAPHIIYSFHFYAPYMITHQGIPSGFDRLMLRYFSGVPYPSTLASTDATPYAPDATAPAQAQSELNDYIQAGWNARKIDDQIALMRQWATGNHAHIICGEFGVLRSHIDADSRYRWMTDVRTALDHYHIGWELWDYADIFGIAVPSHTGREFEPEALKALGLPAGSSAP